MLVDLTASGIYLYAQDRFFKKWDWRDEASRIFTRIKKRHGFVSHFRAEVDFTGPIDHIPINANKDDVRFDTVLSRAGRAFDKIVAPYLDSINRLSKDTMGIEQFVKSNPHAEALVDALRHPNLKTLYEVFTIEKDLLANLPRFFEIIETEAAGRNDTEARSEETARGEAEFAESEYDNAGENGGAPSGRCCG